MKAKHSTRKREHSLKIRVKTRMFLAMKNRVCFLQKKYVGVQPFIEANKAKEN
jgi:hypothetical protein